MNKIFSVPDCPQTRSISRKSSFPIQLSAVWIIIFVPLFLFFLSCSTQKKLIKAPIKEEGADYLFQQLKAHELTFDWFTARFSAEYRNKGKKYSFDGQIRILHDSVMWLSFTPMLGIEAFRMVIMGDSVKYINRMNNTYFKGDYNYVNTFLNTNIDFDILQSFLIGNDLSFYENGKFRASLDRGYYKLATAERMKLKKFVRRSEENIRVLIQNIWIDPETFKIVQADVKEIRKPNNKLQVTYSAFEKIGEQLFPKEMNFDIFADNNIHVHVKFTKITLNTPQVFPFKVPQDYTPVNSH